MNGYHRRQRGSIKSDLIEIGCAFSVALLLLWAFVSCSNYVGLY